MSTILITGATDGLGLAMARQFAATGHHLLLIGRRPLSDLPDSLFTPQTYCQADLAEPVAAAIIVAWLQQNGVRQIDRLIHNAGLGYYGSLAEQSPENQTTLLAVNVLAPICLTQTLFPWLAAVQGKVVFISTVATAVPTPDYAVYGASKAALEGFARSLRVEWQGQVAVQIIRPGASRTAMHRKIGLSREVLDWEKFPPAEQVAARMIRAMSSRQPVVTVGWGNKGLTLAGRFGRRLLDPWLRRRRPPLPLASSPVKTPRQPVCAITGAADGIGKALAGRFAQAGYAIVGIDVDEGRAAATQQELTAQGATIRFILTDLSTAEGCAAALTQLSALAPLDVFIHNAGINAVGRFATLALAQQEAVLALNLLAPIHLTAGLFHRGLLAERGTVVFLSSLSHYVSYPGAAAYAASKDGLTHYARSLQVAWRSGHVLTVFPGPTRTAHARRYSPDNRRETSRMPPEKLAEAIFRACYTRRARLIPGVGNRLFAVAGRLWPRLLEWAMKKTILEKLA